MADVVVEREALRRTLSAYPNLASMDYASYVQGAAEVLLHLRDIQTEHDAIHVDSHDGPTLEETSPALIELLERAGDEWGPTGVAKTAMLLANRSGATDSRNDG